MKRLYQKIYLTMIVSLLAVVIVAGATWRIFGGDQREAGADKLGVLIAAALPSADRPHKQQRDALTDLAAKLKLGLSLYGPHRKLIATTDTALPAPKAHDDQRRWRRGVLTIRLPDQRYVVTAPWRNHPPAYGLLAFLASIALAVGLCAYPVVRGLTRRLERLQAGVETLGSGNLKARIKVEGKDEVARLATSFNEAAAQIETLLGSHQQLLANASHELRTPLARLAMGFELARGQIKPAHREDLRRDLAELDDLIEEILTASRLETLPELSNVETLDLLALVAEECAGYNISVTQSDMVNVVGDARLLRRVIRNLLENARRYGKPPIDVTLTRRDNMAELDVIDTGPGIASAEREKVFEPFYRGHNTETPSTKIPSTKIPSTKIPSTKIPSTKIPNIKTSGTKEDIAGNIPEASSGSGIGLALVRQIARRHGGDATVVAPRDRPVDDPRNRIRVSLPIKN